MRSRLRAATRSPARRGACASSTWRRLFANGDVHDAVAGGAIPANFPAFILARSRDMPGELIEHLGGSAQAKTGVFDTHPSDADRVRAAEAAAAPGVIAGAEVGAARSSGSSRR